MTTLNQLENKINEKLNNDIQKVNEKIEKFGAKDHLVGQIESLKKNANWKYLSENNILIIDDVVYVVPEWLAQKKDLYALQYKRSENKIYSMVKVSESEQAVELKSTNSDTTNYIIWIPKSQLQEF